MNGKMHSDTGAFSSDGIRAEILNPFVHKLELDNTYDKIKTAIFTVILLPFRVIVICYLIVTAWFLACIGLYGLSDEDLRRKPMTGWRSKLRFSILSLMRLVPVVAGFHRVRILGTRHVPSDRREAPVMVMAPHSSFFDAIAIVCLGAPSVVAKADTARLPFIGRLNRWINLDEIWNEVVPVPGKDIVYFLFRHQLHRHLLTSDDAQHDLYLYRALKPLICFIGKLSYLAGGMAISVRGQQASRKEAPILVVAPHSSFLDSCIVYATRMSSVIVRKESMDNYVGKLINYTQPVYVWRDDPNSRQNTVKEIIQRATSKEDWPQILIFPEGTCTNRSCLITFKSGGFYPGVPVQPVIIRYPNARDTVTWTWEGPGALKLLWLTLTQVHSSCEIEFLPVYYPSEDERRDPKLYARNVRDVMAKALGVPVLDYTYDDCRLISKAKRIGLPAAASVPEVAELRSQLGLERSRIELHLIAQGAAARARWLDVPELARRLGVPCDAALQRLADLFVQRSSGLIHFPDYLLCAAFLCLQNAPLAQLLSYAFKLYDTSGTGRVNATIFAEIASKCLGLCQEDAHNTFGQADLDEKGWLTYDEFISFVQKKPSFSFLFAEDSAVQKPKSQ